MQECRFGELRKLDNSESKRESYNARIRGDIRNLWCWNCRGNKMDLTRANELGKLGRLEKMHYLNYSREILNETIN
jgi:hypothetical protein